MTGSVVEVFCRSGCGKCASVRRWLTGLGRPFVVHDVSADPVAAQRVADLGFATLPVLLTADGRAAAGADPAALTTILPLLASRTPAAGRPVLNDNPETPPTPAASSDQPVTPAPEQRSSSTDTKSTDFAITLVVGPLGRWSAASSRERAGAGVLGERDCPGHRAPHPQQSGVSTSASPLPAGRFLRGGAGGRTGAAAEPQLGRTRP